MMIKDLRIFSEIIIYDPEIELLCIATIMDI